MRTLESSSMFISFTAENVRSYRHSVHLSLLATRLADPQAVRHVAVAGDDKVVAVLPAAGIFGANASGKSTVLKALSDMRRFVLGSFRSGSDDSGTLRNPFLLDRAARERPSSFAVELVLGNVRWQYGFEVNDEAVLSEYAFHFPRGRQALVFERIDDTFRFGPDFRSTGKMMRELVRRNSLLLSVAGAAADNPLGELFGWFRRNLLLAESDSRGVRAARTVDLLDSPNHEARVRRMLHAADLGIDGFERRSPDPEFVARVSQAVRILNGLETESADEMSFVVDDFIELVHAGADGPVTFDPADESQGTLAWVSLIGPILDALDGGHLLLADELDSSLHPHLVRHLVDLFQSPDTNRHGAQLIFNAHDVTVMGDTESRAIGRDQIWFTEKRADGATELVSLADFRPRKDEALERRYLQGRFGGVPVLSTAEFELAVEPVDA